jgi:hypothetical protein
LLPAKQHTNTKAAFKTGIAVAKRPVVGRPELLMEFVRSDEPAISTKDVSR